MTSNDTIKKCSTCHMNYLASQFGHNRLMQPYKSCIRCRLRQREYGRRRRRVEPQNAEAPQHNDPLTEEPPPQADITTFEDHDDYTTFLSYDMVGLHHDHYRNCLTAYDAYRKVKDQLCNRRDFNKIFTDEYNLSVFVLSGDIQRRYYEKDVMLQECCRDNVIFMAHHNIVDNLGGVVSRVRGVRDLSVILYDKFSEQFFAKVLPSIDVFSGLFEVVSSKKTWRCDICYERSRRNMTSCRKCNNKVCSTCFQKVEVKTSCSFCRYSLYQHAMERIEQLGINQLVFDI